MTPDYHVLNRSSTLSISTSSLSLHYALSGSQGMIAFNHPTLGPADLSLGEPDALIGTDGLSAELLSYIFFDQVRNVTKNRLYKLISRGMLEQVCSIMRRVLSQFVIDAFFPSDLHRTYKVTITLIPRSKDP